MKRANLLIALGAVLVVVGVLTTWAVSRSDGDDSTEEVVPVVVAQADLSPGEAGKDVVAAGKVTVEQVPRSEVETGALTSVAEVDDTIIGSSVAEGGQLLAADLRPASLRGEAVSLPDGLQAVAVTVPFTNGGAGYIAPGDRVDVYVTVPPGAAGAPTAPYTRILLSGIEVLDTSTEVAPRRAEAVVEGTEATTGSSSRPGGEQITLLLAVPPADGERLIFAASVNQLWFGLMGEDEPVSRPGGVTYGASYFEEG